MTTKDILPALAGAALALVVAAAIIAVTEYSVRAGVACSYEGEGAPTWTVGSEQIWCDYSAPVLPKLIQYVDEPEDEEHIFRRAHESAHPQAKDKPNSHASPLTHPLNKWKSNISWRYWLSIGGCTAYYVKTFGAGGQADAMAGEYCKA